MFNWATVIILLPLEIIIDSVTGNGGYLYHLSKALVDAIPLPEGDSEEVQFLDAITDPFTSLIVQVPEFKTFRRRVIFGRAIDASIQHFWWCLSCVSKSGLKFQLVWFFVLMRWISNSSLDVNSSENLNYWRGRSCSPGPSCAILRWLNLALRILSGQGCYRVIDSLKSMVSGGQERYLVIDSLSLWFQVDKDVIEYIASEDEREKRPLLKYWCDDVEGSFKEIS